ncbi:MAG TPA: manganese transporter, partial [Alteromonas australica]|nr:manganese transporter [Alteromonas australica]
MAKDKSGYIIAAAFIGPGTVTTASLAGANFGLHLVWALLFSVFATIMLQDMAARLGVATQKGLADAMKD